MTSSSPSTGHNATTRSTMPCVSACSRRSPSHISTRGAVGRASRIRSIILQRRRSRRVRTVRRSSIRAHRPYPAQSRTGPERAPAPYGHTSPRAGARSSTGQRSGNGRLLRAHRRTPDARFGLPELGIGLIPGAGGTYSVTRRIGRWRSAYLVLSGVTLDAEGALRWGLVDEVAPMPAADAGQGTSTSS